MYHPKNVIPLHPPPTIAQNNHQVVSTLLAEEMAEKKDTDVALIDNLSDTVLVKIFQYAPDYLSSIASVCQRWKGLVNHRIGRTLLIRYYRWYSRSSSRANHEFQYLKRLFSKKVGLRAVNVWCSPFQQEISTEFEDLNEWMQWSENSRLREQLLSWIKEEFTEDQVGEYNWVETNLYALPLVHLKTLNINICVTPGLLKVLMEAGSRVTSLTLDSCNMLPGFHPKLHRLKNLRVHTTCLKMSPDEVKKLTGFLRGNHFPHLETFKFLMPCGDTQKCTFDDIGVGIQPKRIEIADLDDIVAIWEELFNFIWKHYHLRKLFIMFQLKPGPSLYDFKLNAEIRSKFFKLSKWIAVSDYCPNLKNVTVSEINRRDEQSRSLPQFSNMWLSFIQKQKNLEEVSLDFGCCYMENVEAICTNNKDTLRKLVVCKLAVYLFQRDLQTCGMLEQCKKLEELRLKLKKESGFGTKCYCLKNITGSLPQSLKKIFIKGFYIKSNDADYLISSLPNLETIYLGELREDSIENYGYGWEGHENYGLRLSTLTSVLKEKRLKEIILTEALAYVKSDQQVVLTPTCIYTQYHVLGLPKCAKLVLNGEKMEYEYAEGDANIYDTWYIKHGIDRYFNVVEDWTQAFLHDTVLSQLPDP